ncbi:MAG: hypothetical protein ACREUU_15675 [Gammaproteobacteria bacterium]
MVPAEAIEAKVTDALAKSAALELFWNQPITPAMLQAEMERMAASSRRPASLQALFDALGNDPNKIAECLARPALSDRLLDNWFAADERFAGLDFSDWWAVTKGTLTPAEAPTPSYVLPALDRASLQDDTWVDTPSIPVGTIGRAVWTGAEMLFLPSFGRLGHRYDPATDTWQTMSDVNAPNEVLEFTAVWPGHPAG